MQVAQGLKSMAFNTKRELDQDKQVKTADTKFD